MPVDVGDQVEKGALILRFTDTEQKARAAAAESALQEAQARLAETQLEFDRTREIYARKLIAKAQYDRARADLEAARARTAAAQATLEGVQEDLANTVIRAPYAGIVVARHVQIGETVGVGTPLITGVSLEHLRVQVDAPHQHIGMLRKHRQARVLLPDGRSIAAEELRIAPNADPATHTFRVLITVSQGEYGVYPGMLLKVAFVTGAEERLLRPAARWCAAARSMLPMWSRMTGASRSLPAPRDARGRRTAYRCSRDGRGRAHRHRSARGARRLQGPGRAGRRFPAMNPGGKERLGLSGRIANSFLTARSRR